MGNINSGKPKGIPKLNIGDTIIDDKRNLTIIDVFYVKKLRKTKSKKSGYGYKNKIYYLVHCNKCGAEYEIEQGNLIGRKDNCPCCSGKRVFVGINDIATTHPELIIYFKDKEKAKEYTAGSNKKELMICPLCGEEKLMVISTLCTYGFSCCRCSDGISYPNKYSYALLEQLPIENISHEYIFDSNKNYRFDNYFEYNGNPYILEMDGSQHFEDSIFGTFLHQSEIDKVKNEIALNNNCQMIRIDCYYSDPEYIKNNILNSKLGELFDLSKIDWNYCDEFASGNLLKEIVNLYNQGKSKQYIVDFYHISKNTVNKYLKKGERLNLLDRRYDERCDRFKENTIVKICNYKLKFPQLDYKDICKELHLSEYTYKNEMIRLFNLGKIQYDITNDLINRKNNSINNLVSNPKKQVYMYNNKMELIGIYESGIDIVRLMPDLNLTVKGIQKVCAKYQKSHKGYIFSYTPLHQESQNQGSLLLCSNE